METQVVGDELPKPNVPEVSPFVELTIYADDSVASGCLALSADRLADLMNSNTEFEFVDAFLESLEDGHGLLVAKLVVVRDEIFAVAVAGPRGDPRRRTRTRVVPVELRVGRYDVSGHIHALPGGDPITGFRRRSPMVALTEATIEFDAPEGRRGLAVRDAPREPGPDRRDRARNAVGRTPARVASGVPGWQPREGLHPGAGSPRSVGSAAGGGNAAISSGGVVLVDEPAEQISPTNIARADEDRGR